MRFEYFKFQNFKGIENLVIDFAQNASASVYPLVGLNESGKTTILEAINTFAYKPESLKGLITNLDKAVDMHDLIPINKRDNFNGFISIEAKLEFNESDKVGIKAVLERETELVITEVGKAVIFTQEYFFSNSIYDATKNKITWLYQFQGKKKKGKKRDLTNDEALKALSFIKENLPSILYFPNFLFEFPEKIYLEERVNDPKHKFYRNIIQDILDSIGNDLKIEQHLIERIKSDDPTHKRNLNSVIGKMNKKLTDVIFNSWNQIFGKQIRNKEILLFVGSDEKGSYLEFNIQDNVDTYRIFERSLGFRWFFVFLLFTQLRTYRKKNKDVLFLLDEPASNLHPSAQTQLLKSFEKLSKVIYTTHSHYLISAKWLENIFVVKNEAIDYENEEEYDSKQTNIKIFKYRDFVSRFPSQTSYFQPILEILDYAPAEIEFLPNALIVEGKSDYYFYRYFQHCQGEQDTTLPIIPGVSSTNLETIISLYIGWGRKFVVLLDADKEGIKQRDRYLELFGKSLEDRIFTYYEISKEFENCGLENLIQDSEKFQIQKSCYPDFEKFDKKNFHRSIQELNAREEYFNFSDTTKAKIGQILTFVKVQLKQ